jgi:hypothetical protein
MQQNTQYEHTTARMDCSCPPLHLSRRVGVLLICTVSSNTPEKRYKLLFKQNDVFIVKYVKLFKEQAFFDSKITVLNIFQNIKIEFVDEFDFTSIL